MRRVHEAHMWQSISEVRRRQLLEDIHSGMRTHIQYLSAFTHIRAHEQACDLYCGTAVKPSRKTSVCKPSRYAGCVTKKDTVGFNTLHPRGEK